MGLRLTTKVQVSGWRFMLRRLEHAVVRRDTRMFDDPLQFYSRSMALGIVIAVMILIGAGALALFKPQGKLGGGSLFADGKSFELYVSMSGRLYPAFNLTSARLILGSPAEPSLVSSAELAPMARGQWIGIPGAPYDTPVEGASSTWALCDTVDNPDSVSPAVETAVIAMPLVSGSSVGPLAGDQALLASYQDREWLVTPLGRHAIDRADRALTSAVGIPVDASSVPISEGVYNALPEADAWQLAPVPGAGEPNDIGLSSELVIGSVFQTDTLTTDPQYYVVMPGGAAPINAVTAAVLRATASYGLAEPPLLETSVAVALPDTFFPSPLPPAPLQILTRTDAPALCWTWQRTPGDPQPTTTVVTGRTLPIPPTELSRGIVQIQGSATIYIDGGKYLELQSPDARYGEALYYVDPQGVRFGLPDEQTAGYLGLSSPQTAPWEIIRLLTEGPVLSQQAALLEHDTLPSDPTPRRVDPGEGS